MTTITVTGTTSVSKHISNTTGYVVDGGTLDVLSGGVISGPIDASRARWTSGPAA
jgi:hypothetical protein